MRSYYVTWKKERRGESVRKTRKRGALPSRMRCFFGQLAALAVRLFLWLVSEARVFATLVRKVCIRDYHITRTFAVRTHVCQTNQRVHDLFGHREAIIGDFPRKNVGACYSRMNFITLRVVGPQISRQFFVSCCQTGDCLL